MSRMKDPTGNPHDAAMLANNIRRYYKREYGIELPLRAIWVESERDEEGKKIYGIRSNLRFVIPTSTGG